MELKMRPSHSRKISPMSTADGDLALLLSLQDRVLETPPGSPSAASYPPGYLSDDDGKSEQTDLSVFRDVVRDCLDCDSITEKRNPKKSSYRKTDEPFVEKHSGLRIRNLKISTAELYERLAGIRFVRLSSIKSLLLGDTLSGCWATVAVITEKGNVRTSSAGKSYCIWKLGCLDESTVSLFLFGNAYQQHMNVTAGTALTLFNCNVRRDNMGESFSLSVYSPNQVLNMGSSSDYGVCKGKKKDGMPCTLVINKRRGIYCTYHKAKTSQQFASIRTELMGGNLRTALRDKTNSRGIHVVNPLSDRTNLSSKQPAKLLSVEELKRALSKADQVTSNAHSQGIRFLNEVAGESQMKASTKASNKENREFCGPNKRMSSLLGADKSSLNSKRMKSRQEEHLKGKVTKETSKMIELELFISDDDA